MRQLLLALTLGGGVAAAGDPVLVEQAPWLITPERVTLLAEELRANHPAVRAADARLRAGRSDAGAVRAWEDPTVRLGFMVAETEMRADEGDLIYGVTQQLPLFGKPRSQRRAAEAEAELLSAQADYTFQVLRRDLAIELFSAAYADRAVAVLTEDATWVRDLVTLAEARFRTGGASLAELVLMQNELTIRTNRLQDEIEERDDFRVSLNRRLNRPLDSPWPELLLPEPAAPVRLNDDLVRLALVAEPLAQVLRERVNRAEAQVDVSRRERYPDIGIEVGGRNYSGSGDFRQGMAFLTFSLPLGNAGRYRRAIERDRETLDATHADATDHALALRRELRGLVLTVNKRRRDSALQRDVIIPRTQQALAVAQANWQSGRGSFRDVLDFRRAVLDARLAEAKAVSEQWQALSDLVLCCGLGDLEALRGIDVIPLESTEESQPTSP